jgi:hypothetical protein
MRQFLENMTGLSIYPMISLVFFIITFGVAVVRAYTINRSLVSRMEQLPLDEPTPNPQPEA